MITLSEKEIRALIRVKSKSGKTLYGVCPACGQAEFGISLEEGNFFGCFRKAKCGFRGGAYKLLSYFGLLSGYEDEKEGEAELSFKKYSPQNIELVIATQMPLPIGYCRLGYQEYLESRGFDDEDYYVYEVGETTRISKLFNRVIFPIKDIDGTNGGFLARYVLPIDDESVPRYYYQPGADYKNLLYGLDTYTGQKNVILCEGVFDKFSIDKAVGLPTKDTVCLSTFSHRLSNEQAQKLMVLGAQNLVLMYDFDLYAKTIEIACKYHTVFTIFVPQYFPYPDPGDMSVAQVIESYESRTRFNTEQHRAFTLEFDRRPYRKVPELAIKGENIFPI